MEREAAALATPTPDVNGQLAAGLIGVDAAALTAEPSTEATPITAEGAIETPATAAIASGEEDRPRTAAPSFTTVADVVAVQLSHDQIAERAYHLYLAGTEGDALTHWVTAERELGAAAA